MNTIKKYQDDVDALKAEAHHLEKLMDDYIAMIDEFVNLEVPRVSGRYMLFEVSQYDDFLLASQVITETWGQNLTYKLVFNGTSEGPVFVWETQNNVQLWVRPGKNLVESWMSDGQELLTSVNCSTQYNTV